MKNSNINGVDIIRSGRKSRKARGTIVTTVLLFTVLILCTLTLVLGNTIYSFNTIIKVLSGQKVEGAYFAIHTLRLPRMLSGLLAGFAFGIAGNTFQTMLRNPLANPNVIGITSGASAGAVFCIVMLNSSKTTASLASVMTGLLTATLIYVLSKKSSFSSGRLILVGIGVQAMLNSVISYILLKGAQQNIPDALRWLSGSLNGVRIEDLTPLSVTVLICVPMILIYGKHLSVLELGEESATVLGVKTNQTRVALILCSVFLVSFATATTGPIAFVSFLAGPIARRMVGRSYQGNVAAGFTGAMLVLGADLIGQFMFSTRFPVGVITGIIGAPYLLILLIKLNKKGDL